MISRLCERVTAATISKYSSPASLQQKFKLSKKQPQLLCYNNLHWLYSPQTAHVPDCTLSSRTSTKILYEIARFKSDVSVAERLQVYRETSMRKVGIDSSSSKVDPTILWPPESVRGMKLLDVEAFKKAITVPIAEVKISHIGIVLTVLRKYYLKLKHFAIVEDGPEGSDYKIVLLHPMTFTENEEQIKTKLKEVCQEFGKIESSSVVKFCNRTIELNYDHFDCKTILRSILPLEEHGVAGYSRVGHIIHLNLKEYIIPYKNIIGSVLLDKTKGVSLVVNKITTIDDSDNTFRSLNMEVLAGEGTTVTTVDHNGCSFTLDFDKVYWNPRLSTEHSIIVEMLNPQDVLYDVMAGVGPFTVPAAKQKKCQVLSNDLNPSSYHWLHHNCEKNKLLDRVQCYNMDGHEFIKNILKVDLLKRWNDPDFNGTIHVTMNLPSIAIEFLPNFVGLMADVNAQDQLNFVEPLVHVYMFSKDQKASSCVTRVAYYLGLVDTLTDFDGQITAALNAIYNPEGHKGNQQVSVLTDADLRDLSSGKLLDKPIDIPGLVVENVHLVRKVAPVKSIVRVSVRLTKELLMKEKTLGIGKGEVEEESGVCTHESKRNTHDDAGINSSSCKKIKLDLGSVEVNTQP